MIATSSFLRINGESCKNVKAIIEDYANLSGLNINNQKSELFLSLSCRSQKERWYMGIIGVNSVANPSKYLGVELGHLNARKRFFTPVIERIKNKIKGWKGKLLSQGGKITLINFILTRTQNYLLSCFKAPENVCEEIDKCEMNFWWGHENNENKLHMTSWNKLCKLKRQSGLSIRRTATMNNALLAGKVSMAHYPQSKLFSGQNDPAKIL